MNERDIAYVAGLLDGEGHIGIKRSKAYRCQGRVTSSYHARISCRMVERGGLDIVSDVLGGAIRNEDAHTAAGRPLYGWQITDKKAEVALRLLLPYLRVKRRAAEVVLQLRDLQATSQDHRTKVVGYRDFPNKYGAVRRVPNLALTDEYVAKCDVLYEACKDVNRVGAR